MNYYIFDKADEILIQHDRNAVDTLSYLEGSECIGMLNTETNENVGFCYVTSINREKNILQLERMDIAEAYLSEEQEAAAIEAAERLALNRDRYGLRIKCTLPEENGSDLTYLRLHDAAELLDYRPAEAKEYIEFTLAGLLKGRLVRGFLSKPEAFSDVFLLKVHEAEELTELEKACLEVGIYFSGDSFDEELTVFCSEEDRINGMCYCDPHADGILYIEEAYLNTEGDQYPVQMSLLASLILQMSQFFRPDSRVRISTGNALLMNRIIPLLGDGGHYLTEEYLEKRKP